MHYCTILKRHKITFTDFFINCSHLVEWPAQLNPSSWLLTHLQETAKNTSLPSLFDPLTLALSILNLFYLICLLFYKKKTDTFDPLSIAYLLSNCRVARRKPLFSKEKIEKRKSQQIRIWWHANQLINSKHLQRFPEPSKWSLSLVHQVTQSLGRLLTWQLSRRQSLTPFTRRVSHKHSLPKKLAVHRVLYPRMLTECWVEWKSVEEKDAQPTKRTAALWGLSRKIDSRIWVNFTRNGLRLVSRHQEPPHTDMSRNLATVDVRAVLPGLRRRRTGLLPSGPKSSFQMRASFVFHLETKVLESGGRVEKLIAQVAWSPVLSFHNLWWFGLQCHLLVLVHCVFVFF